MSRIGKQVIQIPDKVKVALAGQILKFEGPKGKNELSVPSMLKALVEPKQLTISRSEDSRETRALHGLTRALAANMVTGVSTGYQRVLEISGVGFKADIQGKKITFTIGYSHPVVFPLPEGVTAEWKENKTGDKQGDLYVRSHDRDLLGRVVSKIRSLRPPEPYKGKGIKYAEETIRRKVGKTGAA
jgi:large subunit ribosomal protein L6